MERKGERERGKERERERGKKGEREGEREREGEEVKVLTFLEAPKSYWFPLGKLFAIPHLGDWA